MKIVVVGSGYVGLSNAVLLAQHNEVVSLDIDTRKVELLNQKRSPIEDRDIEQYLCEKPLNFRATLDRDDAYAGANFVIIAPPTDYDPDTYHLNTANAESVIRDVTAINAEAAQGCRIYQFARGQ